MAVDPDRWHHVEGLYHAALARDEGERAAFLRYACGGDETLRREVESLLTYASDGLEFMAVPALEGSGAALIESDAMTEPLFGQHFGPYEIGSLLGAGGMGDVYRARDTKLDRDVAIKILPAVFTADPERRARFEREARLLAALNHPHIGAIYGFEDREGIHGLVLELVEGQTLAERLRAGPLPVPEALTIAGQIAEALEAAHEKGIVHRDLKPANIILQEARGPRDELNVKVLDFGLAKAAVEESTSSVTSDGVILGTTMYMSPEQARGKAVDERTDIWAFGCVVWEMLTGCAAFAGETVSDTIAAILDREPDWRLLPTGTPASLTRLLQRCLEKNPGRRLRDMREVRIEIDEALEACPEPGRRAPAGVTAAEARPSAPPSREASAWGRRLRSWKSVGAALVVLPFAVGGLLSLRSMRADRNDLTYTQITNFTDSAVSPALSPDGRMLAFIRSDKWFLSRDQIYVKLLPNGEPVQLTHDSRQKYAPMFSADGSRIVYSVPAWSTYAVSPLGGEPTLFLKNSSGVTWLDERRILFSEVNPPYSHHMGVVTAMEDRSQQQTVFFPQDERGMVHLSYASPDRKWVLALEMNPVWQPCRVVPLDGSSSGRQVGPKGACTSAAWSPDRKWMYFGVEVEGNHHLWRQRFPTGEPEQITFGPTEEDGVAVAPDGRSLITSIGIRESAIWIHDARGERQLSSEGSLPSTHESGLFGTIPTFSPDGRRLLYLRSESREAAVELWRADLETGKSEKALPGLSILEYDVSTDGKEVVFSTRPAGKPSQIWVAALDRSAPPQLIASTGEDSPHFGPDGQILVRLSDGKTHYLARVNRDGSGRSKVVPYPIGNIQYISPDRRWIAVITTTPDGRLGGTFAVPIAGGEPRRICSGCPVIWSPDGKFLYAGVEQDSRESHGRTRVFPLPPGETLPRLPSLGMRSPAAADDPKLFPDSYLIDAYGISPGPDPSVYAYVKTRMHRNLFRITLP
jgi:serine/threonine protein kinase